VTEIGGPEESTVSVRDTSIRVRSRSLPSQQETLLHGSVPGVYRLSKRHFYTGPFQESTVSVRDTSTRVRSRSLPSQ
jgi:hypothetical protein